MRPRYFALMAVGLTAFAGVASAQGVTGRQTSQPLSVEIRSADAARAVTVRFRTSGDSVTVAGAQPAQTGSFTTPATVEVPFAQLEVVFVADPDGPEIVLSARPGAGTPALFTSGHTIRLHRDDRGRVRLGQPTDEE
jgi:hypothetical protein